ncbi:hypothetical protein Tco_0403075, partial [Tanacetum coccineum]
MRDDDPRDGVGSRAMALAGTPPQEFIEEVAQTIISTIPHQKPETERATKDSGSTTPTTQPKSASVKRPFLPEISSDEREKRSSS